MGQVYQATDTALGRAVAIKVLPPDLARAADRLKRFEQEAKAAGALNHPNILAIYDVGSHAEAPYVVSELLEGETLRERLQTSVLPLRKSIDYAVQIARGLAAAHAKGIIHRDVKPENLFITKDGHVKILDFGIAKLTNPLGEFAADPESETMRLNTHPGVVLGTAGYMAPEQVRGETADQRADVFSFGAVFYEMLSGKRAFHRDSPIETMSAILSQEPPDLTTTERNVPAVFERTVRHCLEKRAEDRFQSMKDLVFDLEALAAGSTISGATLTSAPAVRTQRRRRLGRVAALALIPVALAGAFFFGRARTEPKTPSYHQLTFRRGTIWSARFAADGSSIVYSASWNGGPSDLYTTQKDSLESRALGLPNAEVLGISSQGEMAVLLDRHYLGHFTARGTLARMPLTGGTPREVLEDVQAADWSPDGDNLAVVHYAGGRNRLEFPIGKLLYETAGWISHLRISPKGDKIAFLDHQLQWDDRGWVKVMDLSGNQQTLTEEWSGAEGLAWSAKGDEIWFTAAKEGEPFALHMVSVAGRDRVVQRLPNDSVLHDISRDGRLLLSIVQFSSDVIGLPAGETKERDLSWLDNVRVRDISTDGQTFTFSHFGAGSGSNYSVYLRKVSGSSPPVKLGEGAAWALSPDGKWVLAILSTPPQIVLLPTGAGELKRIERGAIDIYGLGASWLPDGKQLIFTGREPGRAMRTYRQDIAGGKPEPVTPEGITGSLVSPDGKLLVASDDKGNPQIYPLAGGEPKAIAGLGADDQVIRWGPSEGSLYIARPNELPTKVYRLDLGTGRKELVKELLPSDPAGILGPIGIFMTPDARAYVYGVNRTLSNLFIEEGLK
jgi:Tol biopolymer transport system component